MTNKIKGGVWGIGNVIGDHSTSHVEINFGLFQNLVTLDEKKTELQRNPKFTADIAHAFSPHPDATLPELEHLIGHQAELSRLLELYDYAARQSKGVLVFLTGQYGYGTKALGRTFVDALRQGHGRTAITRFWEENNEQHSRRDVRWNLGFKRWQEVYEYSPDFLKQENMLPFWGLYFQLCEKFPWLENTPLPSKSNALPGYFRNCTQSNKPLVLLLEDFEFASQAWLDLLDYLSKEVNQTLPLLWIITMHSDHPLDAIEKEFLSPAQTLALKLAEKNIAEIYHLSRVTRQDVENYVAPAKSEVAERLHRITDGVPILVQNLWQDWRRTNTVFQNDNDQWEMNKESPWVDFGSGRDYIHAMLDQLWPHEDEAPWSAEQMYEMLALAAQEGTTFTVDALAKAFGVETEKLIIGLEYLLDEPDDPGLIKEAAPIILEMRSANWKHTLERFDFSPLLVWFTLTIYETPDAARLVKLAEGLRDSTHPFVERFAARIAYLYEQANQPELAKKFHQLTNENHSLTKLIAHADLLLEFPNSDIVNSRLYELATQLHRNDITVNHPVWTIDFASHLVEIFKESSIQHFLGVPILLLAHSKAILGDYPAAREYYEKLLTLEEELGRKDGVAAALGGLGDVAMFLSDYPAARGYYEKKLVLAEELGRKDGVAVALGGLGDVAMFLGDYPTARSYYEQQLVLAEELGRKNGVAAALGGLGDVAMFLGDYPTARSYYEQQLALAEEAGVKAVVASTLGSLGDAAMRLGNYLAARGYYEKQLALAEELEAKAIVAIALKGLGDAAKSLGNYPAAHEYFEHSLKIFVDIGSPDAQTIRENIEKLNKAIRSKMSPKRKAKEPPANISIKGGVKGTGIVIGNDSQSNVSVSTSLEQSSPTHTSGSQLLWSRLIAFLIALASVLVLVSVFVRLLDGFDAVLVVELVLAGLISALGISGLLKPEMLADLLSKIVGKK